MAVGDLMQARAVYTLHGQTCMSILHYLNINAAATFQDFANTISGSLTSAISAIQSNEIMFVRWDTAKIFPPPVSYTITVSEDEAGGISSPSEASSVAMTITKLTAFAGRKYRGRIYLPGVPISSVANSQLTPAALATLNNTADFLARTLSIGTTDSFMPVLVHYSKKAVPPYSWDNIVRCRANPILRNQRRRQIGVGI